MTRTVDPFDELAAMFLTEADDKPAEDAGDSPPASVLIELLMVAHLPVRGGLWLTPYADAVARVSGTTALLRLDGEHPTLQQLRGDDQSAKPRSDLFLREAIADLMPSTPVWVIRPSSKTSPSRLLQGGANRITILTSADEAAVVAAYQAIKNLVDECEADLSMLPPIGLAVVGSVKSEAEDMVSRVNATAEEHLGISVPMTLCLPRMDAGILSTRYMSFSDEDCPPLNTVVRMIDETRRGVGTLVTRPTPAEEAEALLASPAVEIPETTPPPTEPEKAPETPPTPKVDHYLDAEDDEFIPEVPGIVEVLRQDGSEVSAPLIPEQEIAYSTPASGQKSAIKLSPKPFMEVEPKESCDPREPAGEGGRPIALAEHVDGLIPILPRCPNHEQVELALDGGGRIHLLTKEESLRELLIVEPWAKAHRELLALACPEHRIEPRARIVRHVFTAEPATVADLHQTDLRLHVLAPVKVKGETAWYSAPLNTVGI